MRRFVTIALTALTALTLASLAFAQEEAHYEGYFQPGGSVSGPGQNLHGDGLVTALYPPLVSNFVAKEYTWHISGLTSQGSVNTGGTQFRTNYTTVGSTFEIWEDPGQDLRPVFYNCPSGVTHPKSTNGTLYLKGFFVSFLTTFDLAIGTGTFQGSLNWASGTHLSDLPVGRRGAWTFGGTTDNAYACIPVGSELAITGRIFQLTTPVQGTSWGALKRLYH